jgi:hypothetical protein
MSIELDIPSITVLIKNQQTTVYRSGSYPSVVDIAFSSVSSSLAEYNILSASSAGNAITFTKGNGEQFTIALSTGSVDSASYAAYADTINRQISGSVSITGSTTITDNLTVEGTISAEQLIVSSSVIYSSGSTKFGDSSNDTHQFTGSVYIAGPMSASGDITSSKVLSNEFKLNAGTVNIVFTGSINEGIFGITEYVKPYISTTEYSGMTVEYLAQRPGACRMGIIMASWLNTASIVFTDISTTDIGDTSDITFRFLSSSNELRLRVNSEGIGTGAWTVQSLFKLFPNLNS